MKKNWYLSKGIWGGLLVTLGGIATAVGGFMQGNMDFPMLFNQVFPLVGTGLGIIGVRHAQG